VLLVTITPLASQNHAIAYRILSGSWWRAGCSHRRRSSWQSITADSERSETGHRINTAAMAGDPCHQRPL